MLMAGTELRESQELILFNSHERGVALLKGFSSLLVLVSITYKQFPFGFVTKFWWVSSGRQMNNSWLDNIWQFTGRLRPTIINISSSVTHMNGPTYISVQDLSSSASASYHTIFVFLIPLLVGVIAINNVQDKNKSLIETRPMSMCPFLSALLIYSFAYFASMKFKFQIFKAIAVMSGSLCSVSLVSIILPRPYGYFSIIMWAFVLLFVGYSKRLHKKIWQFSKFREINQQQLLPL